MANLFQLNENDKINDYDVNRASVSSNNGHTDYDVLVKRATNDIASYQLFYRDIYHTGYKKSLVYLLTSYNGLADAYLIDVHAQELKIITKQNKGLKIAHSIIDKGFIRDVFHWKTLGYKIVEFDTNDRKIQYLMLEIKNKMAEMHSIDDVQFDKLFDNSTHDFASKCKNIMGNIIIPAPISNTKLNNNLKKLKSHYICIKEL